MNRRSHRLLAVALLVASIGSAAPLASVTLPPPAGSAPAEWPGFLGPNGDLSISPRSGPGADGGFTFATRWQRPLGSGYSGIAVAGGLLYTLASDGTDDALVCLDAATGDLRWRYAIAPTWRGLQGSLDGPMSTPAVAAGVVVGLGPRGHLVALDRLTGALRWKVDLVQAHRAAVPTYGFATSPVIVGAETADAKGLRVVVQAGGAPDAGVVAFDLQTGKATWAVGTEPIEYQSPAFLHTEGGPRQLIGISSTHLRGIEPETGRVLWTETYLDRAQDAGAYAIPTGGNRFLVNTRTGALLYQLSATPTAADGTAGPGVRRLWSSRELGQTYAIPVYHDGHIYGYSGEFLTCVDAANGKRAWKSRPPGKGALMLLNDILIAWGINGRLTAIEASPGGYRELAGLQVMELGSITPPAYADGTFYVRNHEEIAAVAYSRRAQGSPAALGAQARADGGAAPAGSPFLAFVARLEGATDRKAGNAMTDAFMNGRTAFPIVEEGGLVHFVYRGRAQDLALYVGSVSRKGADPMRRVPQSDLWYRSYRLSPGGRYDYQFQLNYDRHIADPLNPRRAPSPGEFSEVVLPGWEEPGEILDPAPGVPRGVLRSEKFNSKVLDNTRKLTVYLPPGYDGSSERYPLLVVSGGDEALEYGAMDRVLDHAIGDGRVEPMVVAFVTYAGGRAWRETGGPAGERYAWMLAHELTDHLQRKYRLHPGRDQRGVMGAGLGGYASLLAALRSPEVFGKVATQSLYTHNQPVADALAALIDDAGDTPLTLYMDWSEMDLTDPGEGMDLRRDNLRLSERLEAAGHAVMTEEIPAGPGWGTWRSRTLSLLRTLFPGPGATP